MGDLLILNADPSGRGMVVRPNDKPPMVLVHGTQGRAGTNGASGDLHTTFQQSVASDTWNITHNLGKFPSVSVVDSAGNQGLCGVKYIDANTLQLTFAAPMAGKAYLN